MGSISFKKLREFTVRLCLRLSREHTDSWNSLQAGGATKIKQIVLQGLIRFGGLCKQNRDDFLTLRLWMRGEKIG